MKNWVAIGDNQFYPNDHDTVFDVASATYQLCHNDRLGLGLQIIKAASDEFYDLPSEEFRMFMDELDVFLAAKEKYKRYKLTYKRGVMLQGSPGNGKSVMIELIGRKIVEKGGIVIVINDITHISAFVSILNAIRFKDKDRMILLVMEEIDLLLETANRGERAAFLNLLDGGQSIDNVVYLAATNHPEKLTENIYNRPSRFDLRIEVLPPNKDVIMAYLKHVLHPDDLVRTLEDGSVQNLNLDWLADQLLGFSFASIKEFIIAYFVIGNKMSDIITKLNAFKVAPKLTSTNTRAIGLTNKSGEKNVSDKQADENLYLLEEPELVEI